MSKNLILENYLLSFIYSKTFTNSLSYLSAWEAYQL